MARRRQAAAVDKMGVCHAQLLRTGVHPLDKALLAARQMLPQRHGAVVGAGDDHALQHLLHGEGLPLLQPDLAAAHGRSIGGGRDGILQRKAAAVDGLAHQKQRHHLGDAGRLPGRMGVLFPERLAGKSHQQRRRRAHARARLRRFRPAGEAHRQQQQAKAKQRGSPFFHDQRLRFFSDSFHFMRKPRGIIAKRANIRYNKESDAIRWRKCNEDRFLHAGLQGQSI